MTLNEDKSNQFIAEHCNGSDHSLFVDGASNQKYSVAGIGVAIFKGTQLVGSISKKLQSHSDRMDKIQTNNESEYQAMIGALEYCVEYGLSDVTLYADSKLIVNQINGEWIVRKESLVPLQATAIALAQRIPNVRIKHIHREYNFFADYYSKLCIDRIKPSSQKKFDEKYK